MYEAGSINFPKNAILSHRYTLCGSKIKLKKYCYFYVINFDALKRPGEEVGVSERY